VEVIFWRWDRRRVAEISCAMSSFFIPKFVTMKALLLILGTPNKSARAAVVAFLPSINDISTEVEGN